MFYPSSILLIKLRHHGDVLLTTPVARTLKAHFPNCSIDFLVYQETEALLQNNPDLRHIWKWQRTTHGWRDLWKALQLFFRLRRQHYDLVIHLSDQMQGALLAMFLAPQQSIGIDYPRRRFAFWRNCFSQLAPFFPSDTHHTVEQNLVTLACLGIYPNEDQAPCHLLIDQKDRNFLQEQLRQRNITTPYLLIHPTARWFFKCWEEERFAQVIRHFANQGWPIVVTSASEAAETTMVSKILQSITSPRVHSLAGKLTLGQLAAAIEGARLFVGVDSVPMHIAAALQKEVVALFGASKVNEWHPWKTRYRLLKASDYGPLLHPDEVKTETTERYLANIPVDAVIAAIEEMLASSEK